MSAEEILLEAPGRDLRPDTIIPAPDVTSSGAAALEHLAEIGELPEEIAPADESASKTSAAEVQTTSAPESVEDAAQGGSSEKDEKQNASPDAAN